MHQGIALWIVLAAALLALAGAVACRPERSAGDLLAELGQALPAAVESWRATGEATLYDTESIFSYIDGHAEVYLAYGMEGCLAQRYTGPEGGGDLVLDVFAMASPADAYGVFTHDQDGEAAGIGQGSLFRYGWLSFWQGPFFVSLVAEGESEEARQAALELGRQVAALLPAEGGVPAIVEALPAPGRVEGTVRYLHHPQILDTHVYVGGDNPFQLSEATPAALATYRRGEEEGHLLLVDYPDEAAAEGARRRAATHLLGEAAGDGPARGEDGAWTALGRRGPRLAAVLGAGSEELARALLEAAAGAGEGGGG